MVKTLLRMKKEIKSTFYSLSKITLKLNIFRYLYNIRKIFLYHYCYLERTVNGGLYLFILKSIDSMNWVLLGLAYLRRTERVKSPGFPLLGLARKLPSKPRLIRRCSASTPWMLGWNQRREDILPASRCQENMQDWPLGSEKGQYHWYGYLIKCIIN